MADHGIKRTLEGVVDEKTGAVTNYQVVHKKQKTDGSLVALTQEEKRNLLIPADSKEMPRTSALMAPTMCLSGHEVCYPDSCFHSRIFTLALTLLFLFSLGSFSSDLLDACFWLGSHIQRQIQSKRPVCGQLLFRQAHLYFLLFFFCFCLHYPLSPTTFQT